MRTLLSAAQLHAKRGFAGATISTMHTPTSKLAPTCSPLAATAPSRSFSSLASSESTPSYSPLVSRAFGEDESAVLVLGDTFVDIHAGPFHNLPTWGTDTSSPSPIEAVPSGAALNVASALQRLRGGTTLYTGVGQDSFGVS